MTTQQMHWRVHTKNLLAEVMANPGTEILTKPMAIFALLLYAVGERASQLNLYNPVEVDVEKIQTPTTD